MEEGKGLKRSKQTTKFPYQVHYIMRIEKESWTGNKIQIHKRNQTHESESKGKKTYHRSHSFHKPT